MPAYSIPGVYQQEVRAPVRRPFSTGVPAFLGKVSGGPPGPQPVSAWAQFVAMYSMDKTGYLAPAVRGFFQNGGTLCYVSPLAESGSPYQALQSTLEDMERYDAVDLMCLPDLMLTPERALETQQQLVDWCDRGQERFAILDAMPGCGVDGVVGQWQELRGVNAALYYPWLKVGAITGQAELTVPPCGHIAGLYSRTDRERGYFHAPANMSLEGVHDLEHTLTDEEQAAGDPVGVVNCIRAFPGRGIRAWGARTINGQPEWQYVNVRRLFLTFHRWLNLAMSSVAFETNNHLLWARIRRTLTAYLDGLYQRGALAGASPAEAYYVRCDESTTPAAVREAGRIVAEVGLAPALPSEFLVVRIVYGAGEVLVEDGLTAPAAEIAEQEITSAKGE